MCYVVSPVFKGLTTLEKEKLNFCANSVSSFRFSPFSISFIFLPKEGAFIGEKGFYYFRKSLLVGYNRCIEIVNEEE